MLTARRFWLANQQLVSPEFSKKIFPFGSSSKADTMAAAAMVDETATLLNTAQNHTDAISSNNKTPTKDTNDITQSNDSLQSFASNNFSDSNITSQHTKKYD